MSARSASIKLHREIYAEEAIADAAATFEGYAHFAVKPEGDHFVVEMSDIESEVEGDVVAEFCNFVLANSAVIRRGSHA